jgi:CHASE3 domain sensor protein
MRFLKESLLSLFVMGVVLFLYFVAAAAVLLTLRDSLHRVREQKNLRHLEIAASRLIAE